VCVQPTHTEALMLPLLPLLLLLLLLLLQVLPPVEQGS
jgi:hypothetical protein